MPSVNLPIPFEAYKGSEPYAFVSYAHKDGQAVFPVIKALHARGYRIWYDEGIDPGNEWPDEIAEALLSATWCIVFVTSTSAASKQVGKEIYFAIRHDIPVLPIHLEETDLPPGLDFQMSTVQAVLKWRMPEAQFHKKLDKVLSNKLRETNGPAFHPTPLGDFASPMQEDTAQGLSSALKTQQQMLEDTQKAWLDSVVEKATEHTSAGQFNTARAVIKSIPTLFAGLRESLLRQIDAAESGALLKQDITAAVAKANDLVRIRRFNEARKAVSSLPSTPPEVAEHRQTLLTQIDSAEEETALHDRVNAAVDRSKELVGRGLFKQARATIEGLPGTPEQVAKLKGRLLKQIEEALNQTVEAMVRHVLAAAPPHLSKSMSPNHAALRRALATYLDRGVNPREALRAVLDEIRDAPPEKYFPDWTATRLCKSCGAGCPANAKRCIRCGSRKLERAK
jgi:hypothetical protein